MIAVIDIGNSRIKGIIREENKDLFFSSDSIDETILILSSSNVNKIIFSSVVPSKSEELQSKLLLSGIIIYQITKNSPFSFNINYENSIGIDRLCSIEGALSLINRTDSFEFLITIDFGTATTINILEMPDMFIGGLIAPGIETMFNSLSVQTAQLPKINSFSKDTFFGNNTFSNIQAGVLNSTLGLVERVLSKLGKSNNKIKLFITGGNASQIKNFLSYDFIYDENLVLKGISKLGGKIIS